MGLHTRTAVARLPLRQLGFFIFCYICAGRKFNLQYCGKNVKKMV